MTRRHRNRLSAGPSQVRSAAAGTRHHPDQRAHPRARGSSHRRDGPAGRDHEDAGRPASAQEHDLDLVEVAPEAKPPVCRILDYSKYKYEQDQKQKAARKHQTQINVREIKFRPKIAQHDYDTKKGHVVRFLKGRDKVKVTIMFRGREMAHPERGEMLLNRLAEELGELAMVEQRPQQDGRNMTMMLAPSKVAGETNHDGEEEKQVEQRRPIQQRPAGSADPVEIPPDQI